MERYAFFHLRVPCALKKQIEGRARENRRSMTQEIRVVLERHVAPPATASAEKNFESHVAPR